MASGPALPWAAPATDAALEVEAGVSSQEEDKPITLEEAGLKQGNRIEVKWHVQPDEGDAFNRWWGATVVGPSNIAPEGATQEGPSYELRYDAHDGFEEETCTVSFTSEHALRQEGVGEPLVWRREGDTYDEEDEEEEDGEGGTVSMAELNELVGDREYLGGRSLEEAEAEVLGNMEPSKRIAMAAGFREFADHLISFLHEKKQADDAASGEGGHMVVTEDDVKSFVENLRNKKQRTA